MLATRLCGGRIIACDQRFVAVSPSFRGIDTANSASAFAERSGLSLLTIEVYETVPARLDRAGGSRDWSRCIVSSLTNYGEGFTLSVAVGNIFAGQFHPERSQKAEIQLLRNFLAEPYFGTR